MAAVSEQPPAMQRLTDLWSERDILKQTQALTRTGSWAWQVSTGQLWWSDETYRICGLDPQEFPATYDAFLEFVHPDDREKVDRSVRDAVTERKPYAVEHRMIRPSGELRHVKETGQVTYDLDGTPLRMLGIIRDVTDSVALQRERDAALARLAENEERYRLLVEHAWDVIWTMELDGSISYVSPAVERVRGITPDEAMTQTLDEIHPPESAARVQGYFRDLFVAIDRGGPLPEFHGEQEYYRKDGSIMLGQLDVVPQIGPDGRVLRVLGVTRDIGEQRRLEDELRQLALTDGLTGAWNRRQGQLLLDAELADAKRHNSATSILLIDIDHFKVVNDELGHLAGDRALRQLTGVMKQNLRASDTVVRWGGEEFVILMRHCDLDDAISRAGRLRQVVATHEFDQAGTMTVSIGAAQVRSTDTTATWIERADQAMYAAKRAGRNAVRALPAG